MFDSSKEGEFCLLVFNLCEEEFGIFVEDVRQVIKPQQMHPLPKVTDFIQGVINIRGHIITVMDLRRRLGILPREKDFAANRIIISRVHGINVGLLVDSVKEVVRLPKVNIDSTPGLIRLQIQESFLLGVGKIKERIIIILDLGKVVTSQEAAILHEAKLKYTQS